MSEVIVVLTGDGADAAAAREVVSLAQVLTAQDRREIQRELEQATREATQAAREAASAQRQATVRADQAAVPQVPAPPSPPAVQGLVIERGSGKKIYIGGPPVTGAAGQVAGPDDQFLVPNIPTEAVVIAVAFFLMLAFIAVGLPLARAFARRLDRQAAGRGSPAFPTDVSDRIERIEHAVEAIAIEVERVSEGQRFTMKLLSEMRAPQALASATAPEPYTGEKR